MEKFNGHSPKNARIKIDYSGLKPRVRFSYPNKKKQRSGSMLVLIFLVWSIINLPLFFLINIYTTNNQPTLSLKISSSDKFSELNKTNYNDFVIFFNDENMINKTYEHLNNNFIQKIKRDFNPIFIILFFEIFAIPLIVYFPFRKFWYGLYPELQAFLASKKTIKFKVKDVQVNNNKKIYCELPVFSNVILDFKATQDFSKYLELFEIKEHNFKWFRRKKSFNENIWYARFYFSQKPVKGELKVLFK